jgi:hypothetical protein
VYFYPSVSVLLHNLEVWDASYLARNFDKKTTGRETDFVFGSIKGNWTPFCNGTPRNYSAENNYKKCVPILNV